jgi:hypothetical protein
MNLRTGKKKIILLITSCPIIIFLLFSSSCISEKRTEQGPKNTADEIICRNIPVENDIEEFESLETKEARQSRLLEKYTLKQQVSIDDLHFLDLSPLHFRKNMLIDDVVNTLKENNINYSEDLLDKVRSHYEGLVMDMFRYTGLHEYYDYSMDKNENALGLVDSIRFAFWYRGELSWYQLRLNGLSMDNTYDIINAFMNQFSTPWISEKNRGAVFFWHGGENLQINGIPFERIRLSTYSFSDGIYSVSIKFFVDENVWRSARGASGVKFSQQLIMSNFYSLLF